jgi:hypothetical protein
VPELKSALQELFDLSLPAGVDELLRRLTAKQA